MLYTLIWRYNCHLHLASTYDDPLGHSNQTPWYNPRVEEIHRFQPQRAPHEYQKPTYYLQGLQPLFTFYEFGEAHNQIPKVQGSQWCNHSPSIRSKKSISPISISVLIAIANSKRIRVRGEFEVYPWVTSLSFLVPLPSCLQSPSHDLLPSNSTASPIRLLFPFPKKYLPDFVNCLNEPLGDVDSDQQINRHSW
jgi:hypothetical protein